MRSLWITLTLGLTVFLSGETVSSLLGTHNGRAESGGGTNARRAPRPEQLPERFKTHSSELQQKAPLTERSMYVEFARRSDWQ